MTFQYKVVSSDAGYEDVKSTVDNTLEELGADEWELVTIIREYDHQDHYGNPVRGGYRFFLKKEWPD